MIEAPVIEGYIDIVVLEVIILLGKCAIMCKNAVHMWTLWQTADRGPTLFTSPLIALYSPHSMSQRVLQDASVCAIFSISLSCKRDDPIILAVGISHLKTSLPNAEGTAAIIENGEITCITAK